MNKIQIVSLWFAIICAIHYAIHILLGFNLLFFWIRDDSIIQYIYAFLIGITAFINLTILKNKNG